jgi:hypothetical protein
MDTNRHQLILHYANGSQPYNLELPEPEQVSAPVPRPFCPTVQEVLAVKTVILNLYKLPIEIIDTIIDFAEYWPRTTVGFNGRKTAIGALAQEGGLNPRSNTFVVSRNIFSQLAVRVGWMCCYCCGFHTNCRL